MSNKPSFRDYLRSVKTMDRPFVYEDSKTKKLYRESNATIINLGLKATIVIIPVAIYTIYLLTDISEYTHSILCNVGLATFIIVNFLLYPLRYPLIKFKEINDIEEVEKKKLRLMDVMPYIIWFAGMWHSRFYLF